MWNNRFSENRPELARHFWNFNYEWTAIITMHFPRAGRRIVFCCARKASLPSQDRPRLPARDLNPFISCESCG